MNLRAAALAATSLVLAVLGVVLILNPSGGEVSRPGDPPRTATTTAAPTTASSAPSAAPDHHEHGHGDRDELLAQRKVAAGFARAFTAPGAQTAWLDGLRPYVTPDLYQGFIITNPARRPTGHLKKVTAIAEPPGLFTVLYDDGSEIRCTLVAAGGTWVVASVEPIKAPDPTGTDL